MEHLFSIDFIKKLSEQLKKEKSKAYLNKLPLTL